MRLDNGDKDRDANMGADGMDDGEDNNGDEDNPASNGDEQDAEVREDQEGDDEDNEGGVDKLSDNLGSALYAQPWAGLQVLQRSLIALFKFMAHLLQQPRRSTLQRPTVLSRLQFIRALQPTSQRLHTLQCPPH